MARCENENVSKPKVARLVCMKSPPKTINRTSKWLKKMFTSKKWPIGVRVPFVVTFGGLLSFRFPADWQGRPGWESRQQDVLPLMALAEAKVKELFDKELLKHAKKVCDVVTIGVDFNNGSAGGCHAELVVVYDLKSNKMHVTGKSYPVGAQENKLITVASVESHFMELYGERIVVLGCHDLTAFSNRAKPKAKSPRFMMQKNMRKKSAMFCPTVVLHHPHYTDSVHIWPVSWSGVREHLWKGDMTEKTYASGIAWYCMDENGESIEQRSELSKVLKATRWGNVIDIY